MQLAATRLAGANPENGSEGARSKALCGRLWGRSLAREAPDSGYDEARKRTPEGIAHVRIVHSCDL